ncbi:MAG TPA: carboxypeptidase regulatory-like domain-containing protein [Terriglobales bacterium]|nr:carboxypeptidase regulatory-like domain-containing protein [Terriglobales bacterium]
MRNRTCYAAAVISCAILAFAVVMMVSQRKVKAAPPTEGAIEGTIKLDGTPPHEKGIDMSKEPSCAAIHKANPVKVESVVVGPNGGLQNVVVYISQGWNGPAQASTVTPEFDQKGCQYLPHVMAVDVGQQFKVVNSDQTSHNIHPMPTPGGQNHEWNKSQPPGAPPINSSWAGEEVAIHVKCNIHPWMSGYMAVVKGPYAVSDNNGSFKIENVPPGDYTLTAWQETYGTQTQKVTVAAGKPATANFTYKAK